MLTPRRKYVCILVADGNFTADHVKMRNPENDVGLTNGEGYMVEERHYRRHLAVTKEVKQVHEKLFLYITWTGPIFDREHQSVTIIMH